MCVSSLSRTCACGPSWRPSQVHVHRTHECHVASVCERCDHQPGTVTQILIPTHTHTHTHTHTFSFPPCLLGTHSPRSGGLYCTGILKVVCMCVLCSHSLRARAHVCLRTGARVFQSALQSIQTGAHPCRAHKTDQDKAGIRVCVWCVCARAKGLTRTVWTPVPCPHTRHPASSTSVCSPTQSLWCAGPWLLPAPVRTYTHTHTHTSEMISLYRTQPTCTYTHTGDYVEQLYADAQMSRDRDEGEQGR